MNLYILGYHNSKENSVIYLFNKANFLLSSNHSKNFSHINKVLPWHVPIVNETFNLRFKSVRSGQKKHLAGERDLNITRFNLALISCINCVLMFATTSSSFFFKYYCMENRTLNKSRRHEFMYIKVIHISIGKETYCLIL